MALTFEEACRILEVTPDASEADVKTAYRKLAMKWHPDKHEGPEKENATQRFQELSAAYQKLTIAEEDSIEIIDFQDAFQFFMRIFMEHCQDRCFFDDDLDYDDDLPYTSEEYYDTSEFSDEDGPLDYQYMRTEKPPGFARTAEEALKNAEELINEEAEQKRRLVKKKTDGHRKRKSNRKRKQLNKIKTTPSTPPPTTPPTPITPTSTITTTTTITPPTTTTTILVEPLIPESSKKEEKTFLPPLSTKPQGNGNIKHNSNQKTTNIVTNGTQAISTPPKQSKQTTKKTTNPKSEASNKNTNNKQTKNKETNKRVSLPEESFHKDTNNLSAFVIVSRKKKKAVSTSSMVPNGTITSVSHKPQINGASQSKPPPSTNPPQPVSKQGTEQSHPIPNISSTSPANPPGPHPSKQQAKEYIRPNSISPEPPSRPDTLPLHKPPLPYNQDLPQRNDLLHQFNPIFNPMPSPYVEPYADECTQMTNTAHVDEAIHLAEQGNDLAGHEQYSIAVEKFTNAIFYNPNEYRYYGNRSLCYERLGDFDIALADADKAIELRPDWPKGYFRRARALRSLKRFSEAEESLSIVQSLQGVSEDLECEVKIVRELQLQEFGFTASQSHKAMKRCTTYQQAIDLLIHGQISDSDDDNVYQSEEDADGYKRMFENPSWSMSNHYQPFNSPGGARPLSKHPHSTSSAQASRQLSVNEEPGTVASLWVGNIDVHMTEKELSDLFSGIGRIQSVYFLPKIQGKNRAAFVNFTRADDAANAINALQGVEKYGKCLLLRYPDNPKPPESLPGGKVTCKFWLQGRCVRGNKCAFVHPRKSK